LAERNFRNRKNVVPTINKFYVYAHYKPASDIPFYIGKGHDDRCYEDHESLRNIFWIRTVKKHGGFTVKKLHENLDEHDAFALEILLIWAYGRRDKGIGPLVNLTDGGEGPAGRKMSKAWCRDKSISMSGSNNPNFGKSFYGADNHFYGKKHKESSKIKSSKSHKNRIHIHNPSLKIAKTIHKSEKIPFGWKRGQGPRKFKYSWIFNPATKERTKILLGGKLPSGWIYGKGPNSK
jgi:hypothetical protein